MPLPLKSGVLKTPLKVVLYGVEGVGKSTMCSKMPHAVFFDLEGGTNQLDVSRMPVPRSWDEFMRQLDLVTASAGELSTVVVDTADAAERLATEKVLRDRNVDSIEAFGYGRGYQYLAETYQQLFGKLDALVAAGVNAVLVSHCQQRKVERPDQLASYDHFEMKLQKRIAPLVKEWADMLLFCDYEVDVVKSDDNRYKARGGQRVIRTSHTPSWDAKNRFGLPARVPMDERGIASLVSLMPDHLAAQQVTDESYNDSPQDELPFAATSQEAAKNGEYEGPYAALASLMARDGVSEEDLVAAVKARGGRDGAEGIGDLEENYVAWAASTWPTVMNRK